VHGDSGQVVLQPALPSTRRQPVPTGWSEQAERRERPGQLVVRRARRHHDDEPSSAAVTRGITMVIVPRVAQHPQRPQESDDLILSVSAESTAPNAVGSAAKTGTDLHRHWFDAHRNPRTSSAQSRTSSVQSWHRTWYFSGCPVSSQAGPGGSPRAATCGCAFSSRSLAPPVGVNSGPTCGAQLSLSGSSTPRLHSAWKARHHQTPKMPLLRCTRLGRLTGTRPLLFLADPAGRADLQSGQCVSLTCDNRMRHVRWDTHGTEPGSCTGPL
jgi:hypothetical protein